MTKYAFGIDLGGTTVKLGLFDGEENLLDKWEIPTRTEDGGKEILPDIAKSIKEKVAEKNIAKEDVLGVGIDVPGPVLEEQVVNRCVNLGWGVIDVSKELGSLLDGIVVKVSNDANAAALGEQWKGGGEGHNNVVMVTLGTGVGGGIILDGKILSGVHGAGGEIGHMKVNDEETETCGCGNKGCLEQYASATGITRMGHKFLKENTRPTSLVDDDTLSSKVIFDAAKTGDEVANQIVEKFGQILGKALANIAVVVDPDVFVIGGGVSKAGQILIDTVGKYYREFAFHATSHIELNLAKLGNDAGMYGAVKTVLG